MSFFLYRIRNCFVLWAIRCFSVFALSLAVMPFSGCTHPEDYKSEDGMIWNTTFHVVYKGKASLRDSVLRVLDEVGASLSVFDSSSLVSRVNMVDSLLVDGHFSYVYNVSKRVGEESGGAFDPTLSPLITAWGFGPGHKVSADTARIDSILNFIGIQKTELRPDGMFVKEDKRIQFNFSAVAKGYACDAVGRMLSANGVDDWLVEIGGEVAVKGKGPGGEWSISVDRPVFSPDRIIHESQCVIRLKESGVATSGNYRNLMRNESGGYYGHTISSVSGRPVQTDVISATVVAPSCAEADAYATACMALGSKGAKGMIASRRLSAMLVLADSTVWMSNQFEAFIEK